MDLPFTVEEFLGVFVRYNETVWPMQIVLNAIAIGATAMVLRRRPYSDRAIAAILGFLWLWMGIVYHVVFFSAINPAAYLFGVLCAGEAGALFVYGVLRTTLSFRLRPTVRGVLGAALVVYALVGYPLLGQFLGHDYPRSPTFGLPCPTTIFTFGMLLWAERSVPFLVVVPAFLWAVVGTVAAVTLTMTEDLGLGVAGLVASLAILVDNRRRATRVAGNRRTESG